MLRGHSNLGSRYNNYISLHPCPFSKSNPPVSFPVCSKGPRAGPFVSLPPFTVDHTDFSPLRFLPQLTALFQYPTPKGLLGEPSDHSNQGIRWPNYSPASLPPLQDQCPQYYPQLCSRLRLLALISPLLPSSPVAHTAFLFHISFPNLIALYQTPKPAGILQIHTSHPAYRPGK